MKLIPEELSMEAKGIRRPIHYEWFVRQCEFFHQHQRADKWDLTDKEDAFQLFYQIRILGVRYLDLSLLQRRDHQYSATTRSYGKYMVLFRLQSWLFPYKDGSGDHFSREYNDVQREIRELEEKFNIDTHTGID